MVFGTVALRERPSDGADKTMALNWPEISHTTGRSMSRANGGDGVRLVRSSTSLNNRSLHPAATKDLRNHLGLINARLDLHAADKAPGDLLALSPVRQLRAGEPVECPEDHTECRALKTQHGRRIREMREKELLVELKCQERRGRKLRPTPYVDDKKALCASFAFEDHKALTESSMLRRVLKIYERKAAVPLLAGTKTGHLMALCVEFGVQQPRRLLDQHGRPFAVQDLAHAMCQRFN